MHTKDLGSPFSVRGAALHEDGLLPFPDRPSFTKSVILVLPHMASGPIDIIERPT